MRLINGFFLLIEVTIWYITGRLNTYVTLHVHYNTRHYRAPYRFTIHITGHYNTDTNTLQSALIHTLLYMFITIQDITGRLIFTIHITGHHNTDTNTLQGALIHTLLYISHTHIRVIPIFFFLIIRPWSSFSLILDKNLYKNRSVRTTWVQGSPPLFFLSQNPQ